MNSSPNASVVTLHIMGLGPGSADALPGPSRLLLTTAHPIFLRTARHPTVTAIPELFARATSFDDEYDQHDTFEAVYAAITRRLLEVATTLPAGSELVYAVPGHPLFGETTVARLLTAVPHYSGIRTKIHGAPSFVDVSLEAVGVALTENLTVLDALLLAPDSPAPASALRTGSPLLIYQVYDRDAASRTKLSLMQAGYPDEFPVTVVRAAGMTEQFVQEVPLYTLDRVSGHDHLTSVFVPAIAEDQRTRRGFDALVGVMARLRRQPDGCPWDMKQTHQSLRRYLIEETYEAVEAIDSGDPDSLCDELGDVLLQVAFHAQLARENGDFDAEDVCTAIVEKMIRRHPHIFSDAIAEDAEAVLENWKQIKRAERGESAQPAESVLDGISASLPALLAALETSRRAVAEGFEWPGIAEVLAKVDEELAELKAEILQTDVSLDRVESELGDLLFTLVNVARHMHVDPELALRRQLSRFGRRYRYMEQQAKSAGGTFSALSLPEMEALWLEAKEQEKKQ